MKCTETKHRLVELLYGESTAQERQAIENHLAECESCQTEWDELRQSRDSLNRLTVLEKKPHVDVLTIFQSVAEKSEQRRRNWKRTAIVSGSVVAVLLISVISQLQVQIYPDHAVVGWGAIRVEQTAELPFDEFRQRFQLHESRLAALDDLTNVSARELLQGDQRRAVELVRLRRQFESLNKQTEAQLSRLQVQSDLRWKLIQHDLSQRFVQTVSITNTIEE